MANTTDLCETLAASLGIEREVVADHASHLREAGMLPDGDAPVGPEHAVTLLIALMVAPIPADAPDCVRLYQRLPLDGVTGAALTPAMCTEMFCATDTAIITDVDDLGETFGAFLVSLVELSSGPAVPIFEPGEIVVGGGPGTAKAGVMLTRGGCAPAMGFVKFSLAPLGGDRLPDDAAVARLDSSVTVPGTIFDVLREFFTVDAARPRDASLAYARAAGFQGD